MIKYFCDKCGAELSREDGDLEQIEIPLLGNFIVCRECKTVTTNGLTSIANRINDTVLELVKKEFKAIYLTMETTVADDLARGNVITFSDLDIKTYVSHLFRMSRG